MYSGQIDSTGPRYCPSIEDKVVRFADKTSHQIFLEPEGRNTREYYCNGISTSLPRDVQDQMIRCIPGLENAEIMRYGYAVEYDFATPTQLLPTLETKSVEGLYFAGQLNGTTGYEEAGGQGLIAGMNAALKLASRSPVILERSQGYLGVLIDDLVTKGVDEPYRLFTSRAEYRLLLRQDNADRRLTPVGHEVGCITNERWQRLQEHERQIDVATKVIQKERYHGSSFEELLRRQDTDWNTLCEMSPRVAELDIDEYAKQQVVIEAKYAGYIRRQETEIKKLNQFQCVKIPDGFDYLALTQLRTEAREKLSQIRPVDVAQASRVSGITPADLAILMLHLRRPSKTPN